MGFVLGLIIAVVIAFALLGVTAMIVAAALWLFAAVLVTGVLAGLSFAVAMAVQALGEAWGYDHAYVAGIICGIFFFVSAMAYAACRFLPRGVKGAEAENREPKIPKTVLTEPEQDEELPPETDKGVQVAWQTIEALAPHQRVRLKASRRNCAQVLALNEANTFDPPLIELSVILKRNLPQLATTVERLCATATPSQRKDIIQGLLDDVERLGERARRELSRHRETLSDELTALRAHIAARTSD